MGSQEPEAWPHTGLHCEREGARAEERIVPQRHAELRPFRVLLLLAPLILFADAQSSPALPLAALGRLSLALGLLVRRALIVIVIAVVGIRVNISSIGFNRESNHALAPQWRAALQHQGLSQGVGLMQRLLRKCELESTGKAIGKRM